MPGSDLIVKHHPDPQPQPWPGHRDVRSLGALTIRQPGGEADRVLRTVWATGHAWDAALYEAAQDGGLARERLSALALQRLRAEIAAGASLEDLREPDVIYAEHLDDAAGESPDKRCSFQQPGATGQLCSASTADDPLEGRTTRILCNRCALPDDASRCSSLTHIGVKDLGVDQGDSRQPVRALCEEGYDERVGDTASCRLGGNPCWRQVLRQDGGADRDEPGNDEGGSPVGTVAESTVFIVHGHDHLQLRETQVYLHQLGLTTAVLMDEAHQGDTIVEKFERVGAEAAFVVVILTADDEGRALADASDGALRRRGRQNAILELGYFMGSLGRERVAVLVASDLERPSDLDGLGYISLGGNWQAALRRELAAAGLVAP